MGLVAAGLKPALLGMALRESAQAAQIITDSNQMDRKVSDN